MQNDQDKKKKPFDKLKITNNDGLNISYDQKQLEDLYPNLMSEISNKKKALKINSISSVPQEYKKKENHFNNYNEDLSNPGAMDFIRRCESEEQAIEILNYLLKRNEITNDKFNLLMNQIVKKDGLKRLIIESGGKKTPGYYERKYYKNKKYNQS
ncbi:MAG: DUF2095 family protein [Candidatus Thorarchaeota archaeon]